MQITKEMVEALAWLRTGWDGDNSEYAIDAFNVLDNGGIFRLIDEHTGFDVTPEPGPDVHWRVVLTYLLPGDDGLRHYEAVVIASDPDEAKAQAESDLRADWREKDSYPQVVASGTSPVRKDPAEWGDLTGYAPPEGRS